MGGGGFPSAGTWSSLYIVDIAHIFLKIEWHIYVYSYICMLNILSINNIIALIVMNYMPGAHNRPKMSPSGLFRPLEVSKSPFYPFPSEDQIEDHF